jgi:hypothetical protein
MPDGHEHGNHERIALECITLAWFAIRLWGLTPARHAITDYRDEAEQYIAESAALAR